MADVWRFSALWFSVLVLVFTCLVLWLIGRRLSRANAADASSEAADSSSIPTRWEYKVLLMLVTGEKSLAYLVGNLWPDFRTLRGELPQQGLRTMRALLGPMVGRGWVHRKVTANPGEWVYALDGAGYEVLKRCQPYVEAWQGPDPERWSPQAGPPHQSVLPLWAFRG